jgi:hypothetical protein
MNKPKTVAIEEATNMFINFSISSMILCPFYSNFRPDHC